ncbi:MAG: hypothetical protein HQK53_02970 [Oligoflexia bacterium]|nr:hypothetical protein [Oligoflexia bacterium]
MMKIIFKNLKKSGRAIAIAKDRLATIFERFPDLHKGQVTLTLCMENSHQQARPDAFSVKLHSQGGRYRNVTLHKSAANLYVALGDVARHLTEKLSRFGGRIRAKQRAKNEVIPGPLA